MAYRASFHFEAFEVAFDLASVVDRFLSVVPLEHAVAYLVADSWAAAVHSTYADHPVVDHVALAVSDWAESVLDSFLAYCWAVVAFDWAGALVGFDLSGRITGFVVHVLTGIRK